MSGFTPKRRFTCSALVAATATTLLAGLPAGANTVLFTTSSDFTGWTGNGGATAATSTTYDYDGSTVNGAGNDPGNSGSTLGAGQTSPGGSLSITTASTGYSDIAYSPGESFNQSYMSAIDPGSVAAYTAASNYGAGSTVAYSGDLLMTYTIPAASAGSYFQLGAFIKYDGHNYNPVFPSNTVSDGTVDGQTTVTATIPYTIDAGSLSYGDFEIFTNSDYTPTAPFYLDDIEVVNSSSVPEPTSMLLAAVGGLFVLRRRSRS